MSKTIQCDEWNYITNFLVTISHLLVHLNFENSYGLKIMDSSGMDHNAKMFGSVLIVPGKGQCKSFGTFQGEKSFSMQRIFW